MYALMACVSCCNGVICFLHRRLFRIKQKHIYSESYKRYAVNFSVNDLQPIFSENEINAVMNNLTIGIIHLKEEQISVVYDYLQKIDDYHIRYSSVARKMEFMTLFMLLDYLNSLAESQMSYIGVSRAHKEISIPVARAVEYIKNNYHTEITLDFIAHYAGLSKSQFCNAFKSATGITFITYLNNYRVSKAHLIISRTSAPLHKIASDTGFYSTEHMTRAFQKLYGMSPSQWRRTYC